MDTSIYGLLPVLKAAYQFTGRAFLHLQWESEGKIAVRIRPKQSGADADAIAGEFLNELIDQRLREAVSRESQQARDLILAHALSKTPLLNAGLETAEPFGGHGNGSHASA